MREHNPYEHRRCVSFVWLIICAVALFPQRTSGQIRDKLSSALIESLVSSHERQQSQGLRLFSCGEAPVLEPRREIARALADRGAPALPGLEFVLSSLERQGAKSRYFPVAEWLVLAYAKAAGPAAEARLREALTNPRLAPLALSLDNAIALSLGLTSYVSYIPERGDFLICRRREPRDALSRLILSLEQDDILGFESILSTRTRNVLSEALQVTPWESLRAQRWNAPLKTTTAVGYVFDVPGRWSEPEETLLGGGSSYDKSLVASSEFQLVASFKRGDGTDCGKRHLGFLRGEDGGMPSYLLDDSDILGLIATLGSCAGQ
jgi:hypothetical protein